MRGLSKTLAWLLLVAVIAAPLGAQVLPSDALAHERPAGCHEDGGNVPAPAPVSHYCCQNMHHPAMVQNSTSRPSLQASASVVFPVDTIIVAPSLFQNFSVASDGPPAMSPLRV
jgi:hypothetical protein